MVRMPRSLVTIDLGAIRHNVRVLRGRLDRRSELWAVVKADGYGHGAVDVGRGRARGRRDRARRRHRSARRSSSASRCPPPGSSCSARSGPDEVAAARAARLELCLSAGSSRPDGVPVHLKLDTGMGRWGLSELAAPGCGRRRPDEPLRVGRHRPGVHRGAARALPRRDRAVRAPDAAHREQRRHAASSRRPTSMPSAAASRSTASRPSAPIPPPTGCGRPCAGSRSSRSSKTLAPGESTGYGRRFVATDADPDRDRARRLRGRLPAGPDGHRGRRRRRARRPCVGTVSMDALAVVLPAAAGEGDPVTLDRRRGPDRGARACFRHDPL